MRSQVGISAWVCLLLLVSGGGVADAQNQQVTSRLWAEGYHVEAADGSVISRRSIVEDLHFSAWHLIPGSEDIRYRGPRLSVEMNLRIGGDVGVRPEETSISHLDMYTPGLSAMDVSAVVAWVHVEGFFNGRLDIRGGRQIRLSTIGYVAVDGLEMTVHLPLGMALSGIVGYEVQATRPFGYDSLALDGVDNGGRTDLDNAWFSSRTEPRTRLVMEGELSVTPNRFVDGAVAVRMVGLGDDALLRTVGGRFSTQHPRVRTDLLLLMNPMLDRRDAFLGAVREGTRVTESEAIVSVGVTPDMWVSLEYQLFRPIFTADSIFNVFGLIPRRDVGLRIQRQLSGGVSLAGWSFVRLVNDIAQDAGEADTSIVTGGGGGVGMNTVSIRTRRSLRLNVQREYDAARVGVESGIWHGLLPERLWLGIRGSYWHIHDRLTFGRYAHLVGAVVSSRVALSRTLYLLWELESYMGGGRPVRWMTLLAMHLELWR